MRPFNPKMFAPLGWVLIPVVCSFLIFACSQEEDEPGLEGTKYSISDIAGDWIAVEALFSSLEAGNPASLDIVGEGGSLKMTVLNDGKFTITISLPDEPNFITKGKFGFEDEWLVVSYDDYPDEYDYFYIDIDEITNKLTLRGQGTFDFEDDGIEELASINLILERVL